MCFDTRQSEASERILALDSFVKPCWSQNDFRPLRLHAAIIRFTVPAFIVDDIFRLDLYAIAGRDEILRPDVSVVEPPGWEARNRVMYMADAVVLAIPLIR